MKTEEKKRLEQDLFHHILLTAYDIDASRQACKVGCWTNEDAPIL